MNNSYSEFRGDVIDFDECDCEDPTEDPIRYELPDGSAVEFVACVDCSGMIDWDRSASLPQNTQPDALENWDGSVQLERLRIRYPELGELFDEANHE